ncbi:flagellar hook-length control protein FliK [Effusibacillus dendaii]|uniref:Flagellar hook-length control protein-like C-terminal domain-containing protein n=1 Tax=Effusibacillus dendaii TaxID=2743772 RepID=A0A7I8D553_9BACL|nr:flagellar hook-length control protein FliK [Effusibacillus dendaii]BCJ85234.1 hypothetical protein skT53_02190 [Effusibacillus dendaii]
MNILPSLLQVLGQTLRPDTSAKRIELAVGETLNGIVLDVLDRETALVDIKGLTVRAQTDTAVTKGAVLPLVVVGTTDNGLFELKINSFAMAHTENQALPARGDTTGSETALPLDRLLQNLQVKDSAFTRQVASRLLSAGISVTPSLLQSIEQLYSKVEQAGQSQSALDTILQMVQKKIPLTESAFRALDSLQQGPSLSEMVSRLLSQPIAPSVENQNEQGGGTSLLKAETSLPKAGPPDSKVGIPDPKANIPNRADGKPDQTREPIVREGADAKGAEANPMANRPSSSEIGQTAARANTAAQQSTVVQANTAEEINLAADRIPSAWRQASAVPDGQTRSPRQLEAADNRMQMSAAADLFGKTKPEDAAKLADRLAASFPLTDMRIELDRLADLSPGERGAAVKAVVEKLGLSHEQHVAQLVKTDFAGAVPETLKSLLLAEVQSGTAQPVAEQILTHLTGQQLMHSAKDDNSPFLYQYLTLPVLVGKQTSDAKVHLLTRRKKGRELDPYNCFLYFHLQLPSLGDLGIHVQIVERIVSLRFITEREKNLSLADDTLAPLRDGLKQIGYQLGGVRQEAGQANTRQPFANLSPILTNGLLDLKI